MANENVLGKDKLKWIYTQMRRIREFEERVKRTFLEHPGAMRGHTHLADGAEASIVGALATRNATDFAMPTYRCHAQPIVLGTPPNKMMAELYGRKDGLCKGFGGSMHLADPERYFPGTSGMVGQSIAHAAGAALTAQVKNTGQIVYCFFGDGASKQGAFFETLNLAAIWKLPVVFILENNEYQAYTHVGLEDANAQAGDPLSRKAAAFSIPGVTVDGTDPLLVYDAVAEAAERARAGHGPSLIESKFYRLSAHGNAITVPPVPTQFPEHEAIGVYGNKAEYRAAKENDPIPRFRAHLLGQDILTEAELQKIDDNANAEMDAAVEFALASPLPAPEEATKYVFA
ncbi:MAG TPA: thiamine pyrophosphate-dependent dehydrogenase E1 component subunit alpha [Candidatus Dormibacteraeota bacterium]|nr:thiamine pyrophosphate-dependent dehydrogenase E1 component subunit alpha [Candidatus Dormibacteraeota bacterium]